MAHFAPAVPAASNIAQAMPQYYRKSNILIGARRFPCWVGLDYRQPGASHVVFSFPGFDPLSVPAKKPIKPIYVRLFVKLIDQILEARQ